MRENGWIDFRAGDIRFALLRFWIVVALLCSNRNAEDRDESSNEDSSFESAFDLSSPKVYRPRSGG